MTKQTISLTYSDLAAGGTSDKEYHIQLEPDAASQPTGMLFWNVNFQHGRRGGTLHSGTKTPQPLPFAEAESIFTKLVAEKRAKGYDAPVNPPGGSTGKPAPIAAAKGCATRSPFPVELLKEIDTKRAVEFAGRPDYILQEKVDGDRRQIQKTAAGFAGFNKTGGRVPLPAVLVRELGALQATSFFLDGELIGDHYVAFDLLEMNGSVCDATGYVVRLQRLRDVVKAGSAHVKIVRSWLPGVFRDRYEQIDALRAESAEGLVFKLMNAPYRAGRNGQHLKYKFVKMCSAVVMHIAKGGKQSIGVGLHGKKGVQLVGTVSTIGKKTPPVGSVVEVRYLYATAAQKLYQAVLLKQRADVRAAECTLDQLQYKQGVKA